jgi:hypothetical protein
VADDHSRRRFRTWSLSVFESSAPFLFFDYHRIPYRAATDAEPLQLTSAPTRFGAIRASNVPGADRTLFWPRFSAMKESSAAQVPRAPYNVGSIRIYGRVLPDEESLPWREQTEKWQPLMPVQDTRGRVVASIARAHSGSVFLPFDPDEVIQTYWSEAYARLGASRVKTGMIALARRSYYRVRPMLPRGVQIRLRRLLVPIQARSRFPAWPREEALHDLYALLFRLFEEIAGRPVPWISPWPEGRSWALVLTHDVEAMVGYRHLDLLLDVERAADYRSSWNFVPKRYTVDDDVLSKLAEAGCEVGVHGAYHDGRDFESLELLTERLPIIRSHAERWNAVGFRSPATHRKWEWMPLLPFDYDTSYPDTDPFEPQAGGCCTWLPFFNQNQVELPITLPQDHTLFVILGHADERAWIDKAQFLKRKGGMALLITHPDYMLDIEPREAYARFLQTFQDDSTLWKALPREVSSWWRKRAASRLESANGGWRIVGPAASEAQISYGPVSESDQTGGSS